MGYYLTEHGAAPAPERTAAIRYTPVGVKNPIGAPLGRAILSSKYWDSDTRTLAYQLRDYGPGVAKWLSREPIGEQGSFNLFMMLNNDIANNVDVLGEQRFNPNLPNSRQKYPPYPPSKLPPNHNGLPRPSPSPGHPRIAGMGGFVNMFMGGFNKGTKAKARDEGEQICEKQSPFNPFGSMCKCCVLDLEESGVGNTYWRLVNAAVYDEPCSDKLKARLESQSVFRPEQGAAWQYKYDLIPWS